MKAKKCTSKEVKAVNNLFTEERLSPFAVLNWINASRNKTLQDGRKIQDLLNEIGVKKLSLDDLYNYVDEYGKKTVAKLIPYTQRNYLRTLDTAFGKVDVCGKYYIAVPLRFTVSDFFASINSAITIRNAEEKKSDDYNKAWETIAKEEQKALDKEVALIVKALKVIPIYAGMTDTELKTQALQMYKAKTA